MNHTRDGVCQSLVLPDLDIVLHRKLCKLASQFLRREGFGPSWEAADLVHEAFLRLICRRTSVQLNGSTHVLLLFRRVMRHILVDRARSGEISARSQAVPLDLNLSSEVHAELIALRMGLERLNQLEHRLYQVIEMRIFYGMGTEEIASELSVSSRTVERDWKAGRDWLRQKLYCDPGCQKPTQINNGRTA